MAIAISAAGARTVRLLHEDIYSEKLNKVFALQASAIDATVTTLLSNYSALSNAATIKAAIGTASEITGMLDTPANAVEKRISTYAELVFEQTSPYNPAVTLVKQFIIPAPIEALIQSDHVSLVTPDTGATAGTPAKVLGDLVASLEANLAMYIKANNSWVNGGWTYQPLKSIVVTAPRVFDGGAAG